MPSSAEHAQGRGRQPLRGEPLLGEALRQDGPPEGESLAPRKPPERPPKSNNTTKRLLEADLAERPAATTAAKATPLLGAYDGRVHERLDAEAARKEAGP